MNDTWIVMESSYTVERGTPIILLFSRNYNDPTESIMHRFTSFEPYFWAPADEAHEVETQPQVKRIEDEIHIDALGREIRRVVTYLPSDVPKVRDATDNMGRRLLSWTDMADFVFDKRFLVDKHIKYAYQVIDGEPVPVEVPSAMHPRICFLDVEVLSPPGKFPYPTNAIYPIITIQVMDSITGVIAVFTSDVVPQTDDDAHFVCKDEKELIRTFCQYVEYNDPDILGIWNGDQFDLPYLINRSKELGITLRGLTRYGQAKTEYNQGTGKFSNRIGGRACLDMLDAFKKYNIGRGQRESNGLKSVISDKDLLGDAAFEYDDIGYMLEKIVNEHRFDELIEYCKFDVIALKTIDDTLGLYKFFETIRFVSGCKIMDTMFNTKVIEMAWLHAGIKPMPTKQHGQTKVDYEGAYVHKPTPGIHDMVGTLDVASLYPSIICAFNVSVDIDDVSVKVTRDFMQMRETYRALKKQGVTGSAEMDASAKAIVNSIYGSYGANTTRLFNRSKAEFITLMGQEIVKFIRDCCAEIGKETIYIDTDSTFIKPINKSEELINIETLVNEKLDEFIKSKGGTYKIVVKAEKWFNKILFKVKSDKKGGASKKNYAGRLIWKEGKTVDELSFMGIAVKRSDSSNISKDCLYTFLVRALMDDDFNTAVTYVKTCYNNVKSGKVDILDISLPKAIRNVGYDNSNSWVRGREHAEKEYNYILGEGEKPRLVYLKNGQVICIDENFDTNLIRPHVDWKLMADKCIKMKLESYLKSLDMDWNSMIEGQNTLDAWF